MSERNTPPGYTFAHAYDDGTVVTLHFPEPDVNMRRLAEKMAEFAVACGFLPETVERHIDADGA